MPQTGAVPATAPNTPAGEVPQEVVDFIRYCYQRRRIGWPELYDEMCGVAARGEFRGMDYEGLAALGVRFSLCDMSRLAALAQRVVVDERRRRVAITVERPSVAVEVSTTESAGSATADIGPGSGVAGRGSCAPARPRPLGAIASRAAGPSGADAAPGELGLDLPLGFHVAVDLHPQLVRLRQVEVHLLLQDVAQTAGRHPDMVEVLHEDERVHRSEVVRVVHLLHGSRG